MNAKLGVLLSMQQFQVMNKKKCRWLDSNPHRFWWNTFTIWSKNYNCALLSGEDWNTNVHQIQFPINGLQMILFHKKIDKNPLKISNYYFFQIFQTFSRTLISRMMGCKKPIEPMMTEPLHITLPNLCVLCLYSFSCHVTQA